MIFALCGGLALLLECLAHFVVGPFTRRIAGKYESEYLIRYAIGTAIWAGVALAGSYFVGTLDEARALGAVSLLCATAGALLGYAISGFQSEVNMMRIGRGNTDRS